MDPTPQAMEVAAGRARVDPRYVLPTKTVSAVEQPAAKAGVGAAVGLLVDGKVVLSQAVNRS